VKINLYFPHFVDVLSARNNWNALSKIASVGKWSEHESTNLIGHIYGQVYPSSKNPVPFAMLSRIALGLPHSDEAFFLATPVHLALQRDYFVLDSIVSLSQEEMSSLAFSLDQHFRQIGFQLEKINNCNSLLLKTSVALNVKTTPVEEVIGQDTRAYLSQGPDAGKMRVLNNEIEMLLHSHPVNLSREQAGKPIVNSLWLWGEGTHLASPQKDNAVFYFFGDDLTLKGLAKSGGFYCSSLPNNFNQCLDTLNQDNVAVIFMGSHNLIDDDWFNSIANSLKNRKVEEVNCYFDLPGKLFKLTLHPIDFFKFWRPQKTIEHLFERMYAKNS
jgi:hypothetical protein